MITNDTHPLIEHLRKADAETEPSGLYATDKRLLWSRVLYPFLKQNGAKIGNSCPGKFVCFREALGREAVLTLFFCSAIKVRQFGDRFAADRRVIYHDRWDDRRIKTEIWDLWKTADGVRRLFAFIGFDRGNDPFSKEFVHLSQEIDWAAHGVFFAKEAWPDPRNRGFSCLVAVWESLQTSPATEISPGRHSNDNLA
ncbi:hypothetical protein LBMAG56_30530 [Verrucomicrobiota bacterium]|nr:hypothetical protein LBMAG56_30530 [Verrucomicrobiota bacterium]